MSTNSDHSGLAAVIEFVGLAIICSILIYDCVHEDPKPEAPACVCRCEPAPCRMEGPHVP